MSTVFISYRREITAGEARALFNELLEKLGKNSVFMDVDSIALGRDFRGALQKTLESCDLMLVLIGRDWADVKDEEGRPRLQNPGDFVRLEIEAALKRDIVVTPILVQGAHMPAPEQLPAEIRDLVYRNGFELSHNRWGVGFCRNDQAVKSRHCQRGQTSRAIRLHCRRTRCLYCAGRATRPKSAVPPSSNRGDAAAGTGNCRARCRWDRRHHCRTLHPQTVIKTVIADCCFRRCNRRFERGPEPAGEIHRPRSSPKGSVPLPGSIWSRSRGAVSRWGRRSMSRSARAMKVRSTMSRSLRSLSAHRPSLRRSGLQPYWRTPTKSAETSIRTRLSSRASIFPSRASRGTRRKNFACASLRSPAGPIGYRAKPNGNMPAARAPWDRSISGRPSPPSWRTIAEPAVRYAAKAMARASPLTSISTRGMNRAPMVRAPLGFSEARRRLRGHSHRTGLASTTCTAMFGSIAKTSGAPTMPTSRWTAARTFRDLADSQRVLRGGSWSHNPAICRSAYRDSNTPDFSGWQGRIGLRVVCTV